MSFLKNYHVVGQKIIHQNGCHRRTCFWIAGWHDLSRYGVIRYIEGYSGKETVLTVEQILPLVILEVYLDLKQAA